MNPQLAAVIERVNFNADHQIVPLMRGKPIRRKEGVTEIFFNHLPIRDVTTGRIDGANDITLRVSYQRRNYQYGTIVTENPEFSESGEHRARVGERWGFFQRESHFVA